MLNCKASKTTKEIYILGAHCMKVTDVRLRKIETDGNEKHLFQLL